MENFRSLQGNDIYHVSVADGFHLINVVAWNELQTFLSEH